MTTIRQVEEALSEHILDAAEDCHVAVRNLSWLRFRKYMVRVEEEELLETVRGAAFTHLRNSIASIEVSDDDAARENLAVVAQQSRKDFKHKARELACKEDFTEAMLGVFKFSGWKIPKFQSPKKKPTKRIVNLLLSDLHYGANLSVQQNLLQFNWVEEARRTASVFKQACDFKRDHRAESVLHVYLNGDIIQGKLGHDIREGHPLAQQFLGAQWVLGQALLYAASQYPHVKVICQTGNHGRSTERHPGRATIDKWDSYETMLYGALQAQFSAVRNVEFDLQETPWSDVDLFGRKAFLTHGDTVLGVGRPGKNVSIEKVAHMVSETNAGRAAAGLPVYELFMIGHTHVPLHMQLPSGADFINNGSLIPPDGFAQSIGVLRCRFNSQALWESTPDYIVGDYRLLRVGPHTDADESLDALVQPYEGKLVLPKLPYRTEQ